MKDPDDLGQMVTGDYSLVDELADRLEQAWQGQTSSTSGIDLAPLLPPPGDKLRLQVLHELVKTDLSCRWQRGLTASIEEYVQKFPELGPLEKLSPKLLFEEFRIRRMHGVNTPLESYKTRFPKQFPDFERMVAEDTTTQMGGKTAAFNPSSGSPGTGVNMGSGHVVGGHYTLLKRIGSGGFGEVWRATDSHGGIDKAVKILSRPLESDEAKTELKALDIIKTLNHPYLLRTEGFFVEQDRLIIVMELAECSLRDVLKNVKEAKKNAVPTKELMMYMRHSAEALDYLHAQGIVHRDIKPENILLVGKIAKLADFGLARLMSNRRSTMTNFAGTGAYSPPETWKGKLTTFSDQYSLAVTYGELRLGRMIYKARTIFEFMTAHLTERPALDPLPIDEQEILFRALAKEPKARFGTCTEFIEDLMRVVQADLGVAPPRRPSPPPPPPSVDANQLDDESSLRVTRKGTPEDEFDQGTVRVPGNSSKPSQPIMPRKTEHNLRKPTVALPKGGPTASVPKAPSTRTYPSTRSSKKLPVAGKSKGGLIAGIVLLLALAGVGGAMFVAKSSLEGSVQEKLEKHDYTAAFDAVTDSGPLVAPFRAGILDKVRDSTLEDAKRRERDGDLVALEKACQALLAHFPEDKTALDLLDKSFTPAIDALLDKQEFAAAHQRWKKTPDTLPSKSAAGQRLQKRWLDEAKRDLAAGKHAKADETLQSFLVSYAGNAEASGLQQQAAAGLKVHSLLQEKKFIQARKTIPAQLPDNGKALNNLISQALDKHFQELLKGGKNGEAMQVFFDNVIEFPELTSLVDETLKTNWAKLEEAAFQNATDDKAKDAALTHLAALQKSFPEDKILETARKKLQGDYYQSLLASAAGDAKADRFEQALDSLVKASTYSPSAEEDKKLVPLRRSYKEKLRDKTLEQARKDLDATQTTAALKRLEQLQTWRRDLEFGISAKELPRIKLLEARAQLQLPLTTDASVTEARDLLREVLRQKEDVPEGMEELCNTSIAAAAKSKKFLAAAESDLKQFAQILPPDKLPEAFFTLVPGARDLAVLPSLSLEQARKALTAGQLKESVTHLDRIDIKNLKGKDQADFFDLYAKIGEQEAVPRKVLAPLTAHLKGDDAKVQQIVTRFIEQNAARWPEANDADDTWTTRLAESARGDQKDPVVQAYGAEAALELKQNEKAKPIAFPSFYSKPLRSYADYVQARIDLTQKKPQDAIKRLDALQGKEPWLVGKRPERAADIYSSAASDLKKDGLFTRAADADLAYDWMGRAYSLLKNAGAGKELTTKDWPIAMQQTYAMAAASKSVPDFKKSEELTSELAKTTDAKDAETQTLLLVQAHLFAKELQARIKSKALTINAVEKMIAQGESISKNPSGDLRKRQARLWALAGDLQGQANERAKSFDAYKEAVKLDSQREIVLAHAHVGADMYLNQSRLARATEDRIKNLRKAREVSQEALDLKGRQEPVWTDILLDRSMICLELGNYLNFASDGKDPEWKDMIKEAQRMADEAKRTATGYPRPEYIALALGNSHEDLAYFVKFEPAKNFPAALQAFEDAKKGKLTDRAGVGRGRCSYRWAIDGGSKIAMLGQAETELKPIAEKEDSPECAEANYWLGRVAQVVRDTDLAFKCYLKSLDIGMKPATLDWSIEGGRALVDLIGLQRDTKKALEWSKTFLASAAKMKAHDPLLASHWLAKIAGIRGVLLYKQNGDGPAAVAAFQQGLAEIPAKLTAQNTHHTHLDLLVGWTFFRLSPLGEKSPPAFASKDFLALSDRIEAVALALPVSPDGNIENENRRYRAEAWTMAAAIQAKHGAKAKANEYLAKATAAKHPTKQAEVNYNRIAFMVNNTDFADAKELVRLAEEGIATIGSDPEMTPELRASRIQEFRQVIDKYKGK